MVTASTLHKAFHFGSSERLSLLQDNLLALAEEHGWLLQAWAVLVNHYHFVAVAPASAESLPALIRRLHSRSARAVNEGDNAPGRQVWFQYWDTRLTFERSYLARLNYVHQNAVHHGIITSARDYPWCSARWFEENADAELLRAVSSCKVDRVNVMDDFVVQR